MITTAVPKDVTCDFDFPIPAQGYSLIAFGFVSKLINESARALVKAQNGGRAVPIVGGNDEQIAAHRNRADRPKQNHRYIKTDFHKHTTALFPRLTAAL